MNILYLELCNTELASVLGDAVPLSEGAEAPDWIQLSPKSGAKGFASRDGRRFTVEDPRGLVAALNATGEHHPMDIDHGSELAGGLFSSTTTEAYGWLTEFAVRNRSEIWGKVEWTSEGLQLVKSKKFRGISPAFQIETNSWQAFREDPEKAPPMKITGITSAALTNRPALFLRSLNTENEGKKLFMERDKLCQLMGLPTTCTDAELESAVSGSRNSLANSVPRADFEALRVKFEKSEAEKAAAYAASEKLADDTLTAEINAAVETACTDGHIPPASKEFHRKQILRGDRAARTEALSEFREYIKTTPKLLDDTQSKAAEVAHQQKGTASVPGEISRLCGVQPAERTEALADMQSKPHVYNPLAYRTPAA